MMSTAVMIKLGRVKGNLMTNLLPISTKLRERAKRIVSMLTNVDYETATRYLEATGYDVKAAVLMIDTKASYEDVVRALREVGGDMSKAREALLKSMENRVKSS